MATTDEEPAGPFHCILCRFDVLLDDVTVPTAKNGLCICARCFARETEAEHPMPAGLRNKIIDALRELT